MPIFLNLLRNPCAIGVLAVILVGGIQQGRIWRLSHNLSTCEQTYVEQVNRWARAEAAGQEAARRALEAAVAEEAARQGERIAQEREAAERLAEAAREAQARAEDWRRRYNSAVKTNPSCRAWTEQPVSCPL